MTTPLPSAELTQYLQRYPQESKDLLALSEQVVQMPLEILLRTTMRGHITTSAIVLDAEMRNVLLIHHRVLKAWLQPGGHYEAPGNLCESALREVEEETGVKEVAPILFADGSCLLDIDTHRIPANPAKGEGAHWHHDFVYLFRARPEATLTPQVAEVSGVKWVTLADFARTPRARFARIIKKLGELGC